MRPIVCATRGGEASRRTQEKAIELARERGAPLIFFYTADPTSVGPLSGEIESAVVSELRHLGRALLSIAQARAEQAGLEAGVTIRCRGSVQQNIEDYLQEVDASTLVIGAPGQSYFSRAFEPGEIDEFSGRIRRTTGVEVIVVA